MSEAPAAPEEAPPIFAQVWAVRIGAAMLAGLALIIALTAYDRTHRSELETISETTGVGDQSYYHLPEEPGALPRQAAVLHGRALWVRTPERFGVRDTHVTRVARVAGAGLSIYRLGDKPSADERKALGDGAWLLKVGPEEYVRLYEGKGP